MLARYGGDEFVGVVRGAGRLAVVPRFARRIRKTLDAPIKAWGNHLRATVSIGVAVNIDGRRDATSLIDAADQAMNEAKGMGRNGHFVVHVAAPCRRRSAFS